MTRCSICRRRFGYCRRLLLRDAWRDLLVPHRTERPGTSRLRPTHRSDSSHSHWNLERHPRDGAGHHRKALAQGCRTFFRYWNQKIWLLLLRSLFPLKFKKNSWIPVFCFVRTGSYCTFSPRLCSPIWSFVCVCASSNFTRQNKWRISCSNFHF